MGKDNSEELGLFKKTSKNDKEDILVISRGTYGKNPEHIDIREYYMDANGDYKPTKSGVRCDITNAELILRAVGKVYGADFSSKLDNLLDEYNIE